MKPLEKRALYNLIQMTHEGDPNLKVANWQTQNYRLLTVEDLFQKLQNFNIHLDKHSFQAYSEEADSPEELTELLTLGSQISVEIEDQIYLLVFEIWRKILPEKPAISIICNELDYEIYLHDTLPTPKQNSKKLQNAIINFAKLLQTNADHGHFYKDSFEKIDLYFANDVEGFLYDFVVEKIDDHSAAEAQEILDAFYPYFQGSYWFDLLRVKLIKSSNKKIASKILENIIEDLNKTDDIDFKFELASYLLEVSEISFFRETIINIANCLSTKEELQETLTLLQRFNNSQAIEDALKLINNKSVFKGSESKAIIIQLLDQIKF